MAFIEWKDEMSVGVREFDEHHKRLLSFLNALFDAMKDGKSKEIIGSTLQELLSYTQYHFSVEEEKMRHYGYIGFAFQQQEHQGFVEKIQGFLNQHENGVLFLSVDVLTFLKEWLYHHILQADMAYKKFFHAKGVE